MYAIRSYYAFHWKARMLLLMLKKSYKKLKIMSEIKLTQYSHGAGCGCKISPEVLSNILHHAQEQITDPRLLVGNASRDDAAVYDMNNGTAVISTTDS